MMEVMEILADNKGVYTVRYNDCDWTHVGTVEELLHRTSDGCVFLDTKKSLNKRIYEYKQRKFVVSRILEERRRASGEREVLVEWEGFDSSHNSWEPHTSFVHNPTACRPTQDEDLSDSECIDLTCGAHTDVKVTQDEDLSDSECIDLTCGAHTDVKVTQDEDLSDSECIDLTCGAHTDVKVTGSGALHVTR
jgi:hypothetical protein